MVKTSKNKTPYTKRLTRKNTSARKVSSRRKMEIDKSPTRRSTRKKIPSKKIKLALEIEKQKKKANFARQELRTATNQARAEYEKLSSLMNDMGVGNSIVSTDDFLSDMMASTILSARRTEPKNPFILGN